MALGILLLGACIHTPRLAGPMPVRNHHPAQLTVMHLDPTDTRRFDLGEGRVRAHLSQTSFFLAGSGGGNSFAMDGELTRAVADLELGLGRGFRVRTQLPVGYASGGFLDDFVIDFHRAFGFDDQGRPEAANDQFSVFANRGTTPVYELEDDQLELFDIPFEVSWVGAEAGVDGDFGYGVRGGIEAPAGDGAAGFGNDEVDVALGVFGEWRPERLSWLSVTAQAQHTFAGTSNLARDAGFRFRDVTSADLAVEAALHDRFAVLVQGQFETSTLRGLGFDEVADDHWLLWVGGRWHVGEKSWIEATLGEDLGPFVSPDFVAWIGFGTRWGQ